MSKRRIEKGAFGIIIWIGLVIGISVPSLISLPFSAVLATVGSLLGFRFSDKILDFIFGKEKPPDENTTQKLGQTIAEVGQKLDRKERLRNTHRLNVLAIYDKMASSSVSHAHVHTFGGNDLSYYPIYLEIFMWEFPYDDPDYKNAIKDLGCWQDVNEAFSEFSKKFEEVRGKSVAIIDDIKLSIGDMMREYGYALWSGLPEKEYNETEIIRHLILRRIVQGENCNLTFRLSNGIINVLENQQPIEALTRGTSVEESQTLIDLFSNFPAKLNMSKEDDQYFSNLCDRIRKLQSEFNVVKATFEKFNQTLEPKRKDLRDGFYLRNGGICETCKAIEKGED